MPHYLVNKINNSSWNYKRTFKFNNKTTVPNNKWCIMHYSIWIKILKLSTLSYKKSLSILQKNLLSLNYPKWISLLNKSIDKSKNIKLKIKLLISSKNNYKFNSYSIKTGNKDILLSKDSKRKKLDNLPILKSQPRGEKMMINKIIKYLLISWNNKNNKKIINSILEDTFQKLQWSHILPLF